MEDAGLILLIQCDPCRFSSFSFKKFLTTFLLILNTEKFLISFVSLNKLLSLEHNYNFVLDDLLVLSVLNILFKNGLWLKPTFEQ